LAGLGEPPRRVARRELGGGAQDARTSRRGVAPWERRREQGGRDLHAVRLEEPATLLESAIVARPRRAVEVRRRAGRDRRRLRGSHAVANELSDELTRVGMRATGIG